MDIKVVHGDPNPFGKEAFYEEAMMYLPHFSGFKRGTKPSIALDRPVVVAVGEVSRSLITNDDDNVANLFR